MLSEKITELRKTQGLTQKAFAEALNVEQQTVSKWECGKGVPDLPILIDIAKKFGASLDELLEVKSAAAPAETADDEPAENVGRDYNEIIGNFVKDGVLDLDGLGNALKDKNYAYAAVERAVNGCAVSVEELRAKAVENRDYKTLFKCADDDSYYDDLLKHLLADDMEYVDYELYKSTKFRYDDDRKEDDGRRRKSLLISYALRVSDGNGKTANREELTRLAEGGRLKEFVFKAFERLVLKLRANCGSEDGAEEVLRLYLDKLERGCYDDDDDYYETEEHRVALLMYECRAALFEIKPLPEVSPEELFAFIEMIERV